MKRNELTFQFTGEALEEACERKKQYHSLRFDHWSERSVEAAKELETATVRIDTFPITGGEEKRAVIDPTLQANYNLTQNKLRGHQEKIDEYTRWARAFRANPQHLFVIDSDDVKYFEV